MRIGVGNYFHFGRLKSAIGNKTISSLQNLQCPRRILLTGTPIQNNLEEFYGVWVAHVGMSGTLNPANWQNLNPYFHMNI